MQLCRGAERGVAWHIHMRYGAYCYYYMNVFVIMHVCGVWGTGFVIGTGSGCILRLVRVTDSVVGLADFCMCVLHRIFQKTCLIMYLSMYINYNAMLFYV